MYGLQEKILQGKRQAGKKRPRQVQRLRQGHERQDHEDQERQEINWFSANSAMCSIRERNRLTYLSSA